MESINLDNNDCHNDPETLSGTISGYRLPALSIGADRVYVSFFTDQIVSETVHNLDQVPGWVGGPIRCNGDSCPACTAGLAKHVYNALPVIDRMRTQIALLRIPPDLGPGCLMTELEKVLRNPNRDEFVAKITHTGHQHYHIQLLHEGPAGKELIYLVKEFRQCLDNQELDLTLDIADLSVDEMKAHPYVAAALKIEQLAW